MKSKAVSYCGILEALLFPPSYIYSFTPSSITPGDLRRATVSASRELLKAFLSFAALTPLVSYALYVFLARRGKMAGDELEIEFLKPAISK